MWFLNSTVGSFLVAFPALFSIVNPLGGAFIYSQVTAGRDHAERVTLAWRVAVYSTCVMLGALWAGATIMSFFGVTLSALRVAGGLVVAVRAWEMLSEPEYNEDRKQQQAAPASGEGDFAFFPLTMPFTTGPGTISVAIALSASRPADAVDLVPYFAGASVAAVAVAVTIGLCYASADRVVALLGQARSRIVTRLSAFLLLCIGVQIFLVGAQNALSAVFTPHP
ncbi:multiple antibiotic resistance protein [Rhizobiales bacterium GAS191]|nr:multiple antibiotic resistance protein [Rhizobiales bacterium GAS113]SEC30100.1 multiple antibiotic resistance protein [Rhizobiales bacterium GAS188]SEC96101.1 multiple antibiotic resistance protein [Rhizobiales bacterium GAS191]